MALVLPVLVAAALATSLVAVEPDSVAAATASNGSVRESVDDSVDDVVTRLIAARTRANTVAEEIALTEADIELSEAAVTRIETQIVERRAQVDELRSVLLGRGPESQQPAVSSTLWRSMRTIGLERVRAEVAALELRQAELDTKERDLAERRTHLAEQQSQVADEVKSLRSLEQEYLDNAAVRNALAAKLAAATQQQAESDRRAALAAQNELIASTNGDGEVNADRLPIAGRTGSGGDGSKPVAVIPDVGIMCPVVGGSAYSNTWGAPRSGGRSHQGVDMLAPTGTPLRAVIGGVVRHKSNRLGGTTVSLVGDDGNRYYYAHLSGYEGSGGRVVAGQIVGYVGKTGAANGVPHLHFEIHPGGGAAVNPYRTVVAAGC